MHGRGSLPLGGRAATIKAWMSMLWPWTGCIIDFGLNMVINVLHVVKGNVIFVHSLLSTVYCKYPSHAMMTLIWLFGVI